MDYLRFTDNIQCNLVYIIYIQVSTFRRRRLRSEDAS